MSPAHARVTIALSATMAPHPADRAHGIVILATEAGAANRPAWWRWASWLAAGITCHRIESIRHRISW